MLVSIIIPVYNGEKYIKECIESCLNQSHSNINVIIINDGSTDNTESIIIDFESRDKRISHYNQLNQGLVQSRKNGVNYSNSEFFMFLDADDTIEVDAVEKLVKEQRKANCDIVFANFITEFPNGKIISYSNNKYDVNMHSDNVLRNILDKKIAPTIWGKLIRKSIFQQIDVPNDITIGEDAVAIAQILSKEPKVSFIDDNIYHYIQRENSMVNGKNLTKNKKRLLFIKYFINLNLDSKDFDSIEMNLKKFILCEIFDILRDGGNFDDVKIYYNWIKEKTSVYKFKGTLGISRILLIKSFAINNQLGNFISHNYNLLRKVRNQIIKAI